MQAVVMLSHRNSSIKTDTLMNDKTDDEIEDTSGAHAPQHPGHRDVTRTKWEIDDFRK